MTQELAVEMDGNLPGTKYGRVHAAGCRDLRDPESLGACDSLDAMVTALGEVTGWDIDGGKEYYAGHRAPCVKLT